MAIKPVSQLIPKSTNLVQFEGKKKNNQPKTSTTPMVKAVPLAVLIAMSPMATNASKNPTIEKQNNIEMLDIQAVNNTQQSGKVISTKRFNQIEPGIDLGVELLNMNGQKNVKFSYIENGKKIDETIDNRFIKYNFTIVSDDGTKKSFKLKSVHSFVKDPYQSALIEPKPVIIKKKAVVNYMETLNKQYPQDIKKVEYNRTLAPTSGGTLQNNAQGNVMKNAKPMESYGKYVGSQDFEGDNGVYTVRYYSTDENDNNAENVTIQREGYPELKVALLVFHNDYFNKATDNPTKIAYGQIMLKGADSKYNIIDNKLALTLDQVKDILTKEQNAFNNAFASVSISNEYGTTQKGAVYKID